MSAPMTQPSCPKVPCPKMTVAPMMERTDRHFRTLIRLLSRRTLLVTEMVTTHALIHGDVPHHLYFGAQEQPLSLQLGGDDPQELAHCVRLAHEWGYDEVDLNVGCPSSRVQRGSFGVVLMGRPERVRDCVVAMREASPLPVTVKHRIGFDDRDAYEDMLNFVDVVSEAQPARFQVHARKAWLQGLSPKENRNVPPLRYAEVRRLKAERPELDIVINGGIKTLEECQAHLEHVDGVSLGRAAWDTPYLYAGVDAALYGDDWTAPTRHELVRQMAEYAEGELTRSPRTRLGHIAKGMLNLFHGIPGGRRWRRILTEKGHQPGAGPGLLLEALEAIPEGAM